jgi:ParB-like chromosome segregation protein Spo0J
MKALWGRRARTTRGEVRLGALATAKQQAQAPLEATHRFDRLLCTVCGRNSLPRRAKSQTLALADMSV